MTFVKYFSGPINPISQLVVRTRTITFKASVAKHRSVCVRNDNCRLIAPKAQRSKTAMGQKLDFIVALCRLGIFEAGSVGWWWKCKRYGLHVGRADIQADRQASCGPPDVKPWGCWRLTVPLIGRFYFFFSLPAGQSASQTFWQMTTSNETLTSGRSWLPVAAS